MSKSLKAGKQPLYEHPWIGDVPDSTEQDEEETDIGPIEDEEIPVDE